LITVLLLFIGSLIMVKFVGVELMPAADEGEVRVNLEMAVGTRLELVDQATKTVENVVVQQVPEMVSMLSNIGGTGYGASSGSHTAEVRITLVSRDQRKRSSEQVANDLRRALGGLPGVTIRTRAGQGLFVLRMGTSDANSISVEIRGYNLDTAHELARRVNAIVQEIPGITDTKISREEGSPEQIIRIDRQKAADLGLDVSRIGDALQTAVGGTQASYFREGGKQYKILVRLSEADRQNLGELLDLTVSNSRGEPVVLRNVVTAVNQEGPVSI
jgi:HAE1 family hydrophobic/amphiphilic exporter-1